MEHLDEDDSSTISCLKWVPRGAFALKPSFPDEMTQEEILDKLDRDDDIIVNDDEERDVVEQYGLNDYDTIQDVKARLILKHGEQEEVTSYGGDKIKDESDSSEDDLELDADDLQLLAVHCEANITTLQVWVYEEAENNLFLHHDILLSSYGICLEWVSLGGNHAAVGTFDPVIEIWNLDVIDPIEPVMLLKKNGHKGSVMSLAWNTQFSNLIASGSEDTTVKIWDLNTQKCLDTLKHHTDKVQCVKWHPEEKNVLLTGSYDRNVCLIDPSKPTKWNSYQLKADIESLAWNPHQKQQFVASQENGVVVCYDFRNTKEPVWTIDAHKESCTDVAFHPFKKDILMTCSSNGEMKYWNIEKKELVDTKLSPDGALFALAMMDNILAAAGNKENIMILPKL